MALPALGIDVSKKKLDLALLVSGKMKHKVCENTPAGYLTMLEWLKRQKVEQVHAVLEATGGLEEGAAIALAEAGHLVSLQNPGLIQKFAASLGHRSKTDKLDATAIALYADRMREDLRVWAPPPVELRELRELVNRRQALVEMRTQELNRLESLGKKGTSVRDSIQKVLAHLDQEIQRLEELIHDHINRHPGLKSQVGLLKSIPGVGDVTAALFLGEVGALLPSLTHAKQLVSYCGMNVRHKQSGSSVNGKSRISKCGNRRLRSALYMPALTALRMNDAVRALAARLEERGKSRMVQIGAAMRKLLHQMFGVLKHQREFDPAIA